MSCSMPDGMYRRITARPVNPDLAMREEWWAEPARREMQVQPGLAVAVPTAVVRAGPMPADWGSPPEPLGSSALPVQLVQPGLQERPVRH